MYAKHINLTADYPWKKFISRGSLGNEYHKAEIMERIHNLATVNFKRNFLEKYFNTKINFFSAEGKNYLLNFYDIKFCASHTVYDLIFEYINEDNNVRYVSFNGNPLDLTKFCISDDFKKIINEKISLTDESMEKLKEMFGYQ